jgi:hypothetical protein
MNADEVGYSMKAERLGAECRKRFYNIQQNIPEAEDLSKDGKIL